MRNTYTRYHICLMRVFILLLSIRYNVCLIIIQYITTSPPLLSTSHNVYTCSCYCCVLGILYHGCVFVVVL